MENEIIAWALFPGDIFNGCLIFEKRAGHAIYHLE